MRLLDFNRWGYEITSKLVGLGRCAVWLLILKAKAGKVFLFCCLSISSPNINPLFASQIHQSNASITQANHRCYLSFHFLKTHISTTREFSLSSKTKKHFQ